MVILLVIFTILIAISIEMVYAKSKSKSNVKSISDVPIFNKTSIYAPVDYLISEYHTWAHPEENLVKVGIDNFAVKSLGNIFVTKITGVGENVKKGDAIINAEVHGQKVSFRSPVSGTIKAINKMLFDHQVDDAYGSDWGLMIEKDKNDINLMKGSESNHWLKKELKRFKDFLSENSFTPEAVGVTMYDGGNIVEGVLSSLNKDVISEFETQFLSGQTNA